MEPPTLPLLSDSRQIPPLRPERTPLPDREGNAMSVRIRLPLILAALVALICLVSGLASAAGPVRDGHVQAELVSEQEAWTPGATQWVGLRLQMDPGWHTYWQNPGDSGLPTEVAFRPPPGFQVGPLNWPYPLRTELAGLVSLGYEGTVLLPVRVEVPAQAPVGQRLTLRAEAKWLACADTCIPGQASLELTLPVAPASGQGPLAGDFESARAALPQVEPGLQARAHVDGQTVVLDFTLPAAKEAGPALEFYPTEGTWLDLAAPQTLTRTPTGHRLELKRAPVDPRPPASVKGILVRPGAGGWAVQLEAPVGQAAAAATASPADAAGPVRSSLGEVHSLRLALVFAFFGGMILNLMPCVFPVISLKVMAFVEHGGNGLKQALVFTGGVLASFWLVAGALLVLRAGGQHLGWGFQLQSPLFVALMASLFFGIALNLLGVFEVGLGLTRLGQVGSTGSGSWNSFLSGVLATLVATPCTAPYMGSAIGFSLTQPAWASLLVFTTLALGMASPYVVLASWPALLRRLPRPGAWMETFKQALSFPLLLTVVFFVWVLDRQAGPQAVAALLTGLVLLGMAGWLYGRWGFSDRALPRLLAALCLLAGLGVAGFGAQRLATTTQVAPPEATVWEAWSPRLVEALLAEGRPVFLDFSASWCLSCQANEQMALNRPEVIQAFRERGVATLKADWTNRDEAITRALASFGRSGVPLYVLYSGRAGEPPRILPEVLTPGLVLEALAELPSSPSPRREP